MKTLISSKINKAINNHDKQTKPFTHEINPTCVVLPLWNSTPLRESTWSCTTVVYEMYHGFYVERKPTSVG
jgi:tetrahydromethanopterin S-methyltransferase subunit B